MKQFFIFLMLLSSCWSFSCRTNKEGSYAQQRQESLLQGRSSAQWHHYDSTARYWYYHSDSSFYFHPDSGLYGSAGWLIVKETLLKNKYGEARKDTLTHLLEEHAEESYKKVSESRPSRLWWYVLGVGLVISIISYSVIIVFVK